MADRTITLTEQEIQRLEAILMDADRNDAFAFLREVLKPKLATSTGHGCGPKPG